MNYWYMRKWDGSEVRVNPRPETIDFIKQRLSQGGGHIITKNATIAVSDVKEFYESDEPVINPERLLAGATVLEEASQAFNDPILKDEAVAARAVKRRIPRRKWDAYYSKSNGYHLLDEGDTYVTMAFYLPTHLVNPLKHDYCTPEEILYLKTY